MFHVCLYLILSREISVEIEISVPSNRATKKNTYYKHLPVSSAHSVLGTTLTLVDRISPKNVSMSICLEPLKIPHHTMTIFCSCHWCYQLWTYVGLILNYSGRPNLITWSYKDRELGIVRVRRQIEIPSTWRSSLYIVFVSECRGCM